MAISFDSALGIHDDALLLRARRAEILANNIANADTPGYQARDIDFESILRGSSENPMDDVSLARTDAAHEEQFLQPDLAAELMYRIPYQPSVDGNTVEVQEEMARYTDNALRFQSSFTLLNNKFTGLQSAITGE